MNWQSRLAFRKILIIQTAFIGDVLLVTPLIKAVKKKYPSSRLDVMVIPACAEILENNNHIANIILFDKKKNDGGISGFIQVLRKTHSQGYDLVIAPHRSLRTALLAFFSGAKVRIGFDNSAGGFLYNVKAKHRWGIHEIERNLSLISQPDGEAELSPPQIFPDKQDEQKLAEIIKACKIDQGEKAVAIAPGSVWPTKRWPQDRYKALIQKLVESEVKVVLLGGKTDKKLCQALAQGFRQDVINLAGLLTLRQSTLFLSHCRCLVSNDSAPVHLVSAVQTPTIVLFGPTIPAFGFGPFMTKHVIIQRQLACRPCGVHGAASCPIKTHACLTSISVDEVMDKILDFCAH
jgi:heptosyltransferase-2